MRIFGFAEFLSRMFDERAPLIGVRSAAPNESIPVNIKLQLGGGAENSTVAEAESIRWDRDFLSCVPGNWVEASV